MTESDERQAAAGGDTPATRSGPGGALAATPRAPDVLPMPVFLEFLRRLHDGPPQAAAVRAAMALWQRAAERGDRAQAREALSLAREQLDQLIRDLAQLQETGRRWSGCPSPSHAELAAEADAAAHWEGTRTADDRP
jgi:hypothetical protein